MKVTITFVQHWIRGNQKASDKKKLTVGMNRERKHDATEQGTKVSGKGEIKKGGPQEGGELT